MPKREEETHSNYEFGSRLDKLGLLRLEKLLEPPKKVGLKGLGPGIVMAMMSIGSGEIFLWPLLVSRYGPAIFWLFFYGALLQYWFHEEVARYTIVTGESLYQGLERVVPYSHIYWMLQGILGAL